MSSTCTPTHIRIHASICDATPGLCAHDWQCTRHCPGKPARYSGSGKHADTLRQSIQAAHGLTPSTPGAYAPESDEARDRASAPAPTAEEAFAGLYLIVTAVLAVVAIGSALAALQGVLAVIR